MVSEKVGDDVTAWDCSKCGIYRFYMFVWNQISENNVLMLSGMDITDFKANWKIWKTQIARRRYSKDIVYCQYQPHWQCRLTGQLGVSWFMWNIFWNVTMELKHTMLGCVWLIFTPIERWWRPKIDLFLSSLNSTVTHWCLNWSNGGHSACYNLYHFLVLGPFTSSFVSWTWQTRVCFCFCLFIKTIKHFY